MNLPIHPGMATEPDAVENPALLQECLGSPDGLGSLGPAWWSRGALPTSHPTALRGFLEHYRSTVLLPVELPAIQRACLHAGGYQVRELIELDRHLAHGYGLPGFAFASEAVGRGFLRRLRPLRDVRLLQRYERAVQAGQAHGWHTLVFGVVLNIYSLPLRQSLLSYARQTLLGFVRAGALRLPMKPGERREMERALTADLPENIQNLCTSSLCCLPDRAPWST